jgi:hypothetical protein
MDNNRELKFSIFSVIHIPPLPTVVSRVDRDDNTVVDDDAVESSHSIIGSMMDWSAMANNETANRQRMHAQLELFEKFKEELLNIDLKDCTEETLYEFYCGHTRRWLNTYSTAGNMLRFKPLDYIVTNDKSHQNMRGYTKAQYLMYARRDTNFTKDALKIEDSVPYGDLLRKCAQWTQESFNREDNSNHADEVFNTDEIIPSLPAAEMVAS